MPGAKVIGFGANLSTTRSNVFVGSATRICATSIGSEKSRGTKIAEARVLRSSPMYFRFAKKLISPSVASPSDAAPLICSDGSPSNSPSHIADNSLRVKVTGILELLKRQGRVGSPLHAAARTGIQALPFASSCHSPIRDSFFLPARRALFDEGLHAFKRCFVHHVARHDLARRFVCGCDAELRLSVEKFFAHCDGNAWFADDRGDESLEFRIELVGFCDAVDQATRFCLLRTDEFSGDQHFERLLAQNIS